VSEELEVARFYRTTKYPKVMGRFYDGTKIPGGPYTMTQGVVGAIALFVVLQTSALWARGNILIDLPLGTLIVWGTAWVAGRIRVGNRNPAVLLVGLFKATTSPGQGQYNDLPYRAKTPHQVRGRVITDLPITDVRPAKRRAKQPRPEQPAPVPAKPSTAPQTAAVETPRAVSAVERLLAQSNSK
jgi:hypothetical protein